MFKTQDLHVREIVRLSSPRTVKDLFPALPEASATVVQSRERIIRILRQTDPAPAGGRRARARFTMNAARWSMPTASTGCARNWPTAWKS